MKEAISEFDMPDGQKDQESHYFLHSSFFEKYLSHEQVRAHYSHEGAEEGRHGDRTPASVFGCICDEMYSDRSKGPSHMLKKG